MISKILEFDYKGFHLVLDEEEHGWKCIIGDKEILFPHSQAAKAAISAILKDADKAIKSEGGVALRKVVEHSVTKIVEIEKLY